MTCVLAWETPGLSGDWWRVSQCRNLPYGCQWETIGTLPGQAHEGQVSGLPVAESYCWQVQTKGGLPSNVVCR